MSVVALVFQQMIYGHSASNWASHTKNRLPRAPLRVPCPMAGSPVVAGSPVARLSRRVGTGFHRSERVAFFDRTRGIMTTPTRAPLLPRYPPGIRRAFGGEAASAAAGAGYQ